MRTTLDRIRHTLLFEVIAILLTVCIVGLFLDNSPAEVGALGITLSLLAMVWNYVYNLMFDNWLAAKNGGQLPRERSAGIRALHAALFEGGFVAVSLPLIAWWLNLPLLQAFMMDIGLTLFFMVYTFGFNWGYDQLFPLPENAKEHQSEFASEMASAQS